MRAELDRIQNKLEDTKDKFMDSQRRVSELVERADKAEKDALNTSQQYATQANHLQATHVSKVTFLLLVLLVSFV